MFLLAKKTHFIAFLTVLYTRIFFVKVTPKKGAAKKLTAKITVKTPTVKFTDDVKTVQVGSTAYVKAAAVPANASVKYYSADKSIATVGLTSGKVIGKADGTLKVAAVIKTGTKTTKVYKEITVYAPLDIADVVPSADASVLSVLFTTPVKAVEARNFYFVGGEISVANAKLSEDGKSATLTLDKSLTSTVKYTLKAYNLEPVNGEAKAELTKDVTWTYSDGAKVEAGTLAKIGEEASVKITNAKGGNVTTVNSIKVTTSNAGIVDVTPATAVAGTLKNVPDVKLVAKASGTATVTVKAVLTDGTTLTQIFTYTIGDVTVANKGYTLYGATNASTATAVAVMASAPANTVEMANATATTTLRWVNPANKPTAKLALYLTKNGDPEDEKVDFTGAKVESLDPSVATAAIAGDTLTVTAQYNTTATAQFRVTMNNDKKDVYTFSVNVQKAPELTSIVTDTPSVTLSDEAAIALGTKAANSVEGVDQKTVTVTFKDQYGDDFALPTDFAGKLVVSSNSVEGLSVKAGTPVAGSDVVETPAEGNIEYKAAALKTGAISNITYVVSAQKDKLASATISAKLFEKADDATAKYSVNTSVTTVNVDGAATASDVKQLGGLDAAYTIDANDNVAADDNVDFSAKTYYLLDAKGNKLAKADTTVGVYVEEDPTFKQNCWIKLTSNKKVEFDTNATNLASVAGSEKVVVKVANDGYSALAAGDTNFVSQTVTINYTNTKAIPHKATVATTNIKLTGVSETLTLEDIVFGKIDADQMLKDKSHSGNTIFIGGTDDRYMVAKGVAKNNGYKYNTSVLSITDMNGKTIPTGTSLYGLAASVTTGNAWMIKNDGTVDTLGDFEINDFTIADVTGSSSTAIGKVNATTGALTTALTTGEYVSFKLVLRDVRVNGDTDTHKDANLLSAPVTISVTISR